MSHIEYEAKFPNIEKDVVREKLTKHGAKLLRKEFLQKRVGFNLPDEKHDAGKWVRVRDEGDKITMSLKEVNNAPGAKIEDQKETMIVVNDFETACELLEKLGCKRKAFQESKRELWLLDGVEVTIDEWPFLEPFVEVEGKTEDEVKIVSQKLDFEYSKAVFGSVSSLYKMKYNISHERVHNETPLITFDIKENPFL